MALCGKVNSPAWRVPHASSCKLTASTRSFPIPWACRLGRTVIGPKNPTLPHLVDEI